MNLCPDTILFKTILLKVTIVCQLILCGKLTEVCLFVKFIKIDEVFISITV